MRFVSSELHALSAFAPLQNRTEATSNHFEAAHEVRRLYQQHFPFRSDQ